MEKCRKCGTLNSSGWIRVTPIAAIALAAMQSIPAVAKDECTTVKQCAQQMVLLANELKKENTALAARVAALELALERRTVEAAIESRLTRFRLGSKNTVRPGGRESELCPEGQYMVGANFEIREGVPHGYISWFGPICRTMP